MPLAAAEDLDQLEQQAFLAAVARVAPSVVRIETVGGLDRVGNVLVGTGPTTGLIVAPEGYVISSAFNFLHRPASVLVQLPDGTRKPARLVATDHNRMLVLLKIEAERPLPVPQAAPPGETRVGQWAIGVGRTFEVGAANISVGVVSAINRIWGKALQTDAAVSPNNYGGPLVDVRGRVLGVLVPLSPEETGELAGIEWYDSGIGFAVPMESVLQAVARLKQGKDLYCGMTGINLPAKTLHTGDAVIAGSRPRSPAHRAGLRAGDRIVEIEAMKIDRAAQVKQEISRRYAGDAIRLAVVRDGKRIETWLELVAQLEPYQQPFLGVLPLRPTGPEGDGKTPAVTVRYVYPQSPAARAGIEPGDVLALLGAEPIADLPKFRARLAEKQPGDAVELEVRRGAQARKVQLKLADVPEAVPPAPIPPAHAPVQPGGAKRPEVGTIALKVPGAAGETWVYVPDGYTAQRPHGIVVWLHGSEGLDPKELIARWKPLCDRSDLILIAPKAAASGRWRPAELRLLPMLLAQVASAYTVDPTRVVVAGGEGGGVLAYMAAFNSGGTVRGAAAIDAPMTGAVSGREPPLGLAFYVARAQGSRSAAAIQQTIARLRQMKFPVTVKELGPQVRALTAEELAELVRWIDTLDRL
jgi:serine protease Do